MKGIVAVIIVAILILVGGGYYLYNYTDFGTGFVAFKQDFDADGDGNGVLSGTNKVIFSEEVFLVLNSYDIEDVFEPIRNYCHSLWYKEDGLWQFYDFSDKSGYLNTLESDIYYYLIVTEDCTLTIP